MTLTFTPISQLGLITTPESNDTLLLLDASTANQAGRITLEILGSFLANTAAQIDWANILNKPSTFPPVSHTHTKGQITDLSLDWQGITDKPSAFPPASHTHIPADILGFDSAVDARLGNLPNGAIIGGVAHFTGEVPPATRRDGSLIQIGDRFLEAADDYFWNGVLWLGKLQTWDLSTFVSTTTPLYWRQALGLGSNIFVRGCKSSLWTNVAHSNINYWNINILVDYTKSSASSGTELAGEIANTLGLPAFSWRIRYREINQVIPADVPFIVVAQKVGNPGGSFVTGQTLYYHEIME